MLLYQILAYIKKSYTNIKKSCKNSKFKISALTCNENFELPEGSYSVSDIQDYFEYIKHKIVIDNLLVRIYVNIIEKR